MQRPAYITGIGAYLPGRVLTNTELVANMPWLDVSADWIAEHTGIEQRHVAAPDQHAADLGLQAARKALAQARCDPDDIQLLLLATNSADLVYPASASRIQHGLGVGANRGMLRTTAMDLQQGCASFLAAIVLAASMVQSEHCQKVLVVGADVATRMVDWSERNCVLLGDGAAACVVSGDLPAAPRPMGFEILGSYMRTMPDQDAIFQRGVLDRGNDPFQHIEYAKALGVAVDHEQLYARLQRPAGSDLFHMDGRKVYRFVRRMVASSGYLEVMCRSGLASAEEQQRIRAHVADDASALVPLGDAFLDRLGSRIDRFVPHGANMFLDQELAEQMHIPYERMAVTLQDTGNTSAASVGITLARLLAGSVQYSTIAKRDAAGNVQRPSQRITVPPLQPGMTTLMLSFGAGTSWNYVAARAV